MVAATILTPSLAGLTEGEEPPSTRPTEANLTWSNYGNNTSYHHSFTFSGSQLPADPSPIPSGTPASEVSVGAASKPDPESSPAPSEPPATPAAVPQPAANAVSRKPSPAKQSDSTVRIIGDSYEQCVIYVQRVTGDRRAHGYAGDLQPTGSEPRVGAVALERDYGHVSLVVAVEGDYVVLHDANWVKGHITERRVLASTQRGYIY